MDQFIAAYEQAVFFEVSGDDSGVRGLVQGLKNAQFQAQRLDGTKMRTAQEMFREFSDALRFPAYFGANWDALEECLADLDWLPPGRGYVLVLSEAGHVLDGSDEQLSTLAKMLLRIADEWSRPVELGEWWDRPSVRFSVIVDLRSEVDVQRWRRAGADLVRLTVR